MTQVYGDLEEAAMKRRLGHKHEYVIPVEWEYGYTNAEKEALTALLADKADDKGSMETFFDLKKVTKLRCACGDEVAR